LGIFFRVLNSGHNVDAPILRVEVPQIFYG
jgi:hypothetical protein